MRVARPTRKTAGDVFINVPFDTKYERLYLALVTGVVGLGLTPRCAVEVPHDPHRLERILEADPRLQVFHPRPLARPTCDHQEGIPCASIQHALRAGACGGHRPRLTLQAEASLASVRAGALPIDALPYGSKRLRPVHASRATGAAHPRTAERLREPSRAADQRAMALEGDVQDGDEIPPEEAAPRHLRGEAIRRACHRRNSRPRRSAGAP